MNALLNVSSLGDRYRQLLNKTWRRIPLLDRWLLSELLGPLVFGIGAFTAVSLSVGAVFDLVRKVAESGLPLQVAAHVLILQTPSFLVLSFPMATLMATLLTYSKLSSNSELTALRSVGVATWRMVVPAMVLALAMTVITFTFNEVVVPSSLYQAKLVLNRALGRAIAGEQRDNVVYSKYGTVTNPDGSQSKGLTHFFYAQRYNKGVMEQVTMLDLSRGSQRVMLTADNANWSDKDSQWLFRNGHIFSVQPDRKGATTSADFDRYLYPLGSGPVKMAVIPGYETMTIGQARTAVKLLKESGDAKEARKLTVRIQERFSFPAVCLVFGLMGSSLGVQPQSRHSRSQGFGLSVVLIFSYYLLAFMSSSLGVKGVLPPYVSAWIPVLLGLGGGLYLLRQSSR
jgi:lipopolysaccharide export system permease protein